jgi:hypothetical protein
MKNIVQRWSICYFFSMIADRRYNGLNALHVKNENKADLLKLLIFFCLKGNDNMVKSIQNIKASLDTYYHNSKIMHLYFQKYAGEITVHMAIFKTTSNLK